MYHNQILKDRYGQHFKIQSDRDGTVHKAIQAESFWNPLYTRQFIQGLNAPAGYWRKLIKQFSTLPAIDYLHDHEVENQLSQLLMQGRLKVYAVSIPDFSEQPPEKRVIKSGDTMYRFSAASSLLINNPREVKTFQGQKEAKAFLKELDADEQQLQDIAKQLDITLPATASVNNEELNTTVSRALASGEIVIIVDRFTTPPPPMESKIVEAANTVGNRKADLGPPPDEFKDIHIQLEDEFEKQLSNHFSLFNGLEYSLKTDMGEEHKGTIENGEIKIQQTKMNSTFELQIKDMPAFMDV